MNEIAFTKVDLPFGWLGNMANFPIRYEGVLFKNSEMLFQFLRFSDFPDTQKEIFNQKSPMAVKMIAKKHKHHLPESVFPQVHTFPSSLAAYILSKPAHYLTS
jgi:predicted NAD-dependent protein-ADP-ribosyltransferase YbiA (DUF1768 family)